MHSSQATQQVQITPQQKIERLAQILGHLQKLDSNSADLHKYFDRAINHAKTIECDSLKPTLFSVISKYVESTSETSFLAWKLSIYYLKCCKSVDELIKFRNLLLDQASASIESFVGRLQALVASSGSLDDLTLVILTQDVFVELLAGLLNGFNQLCPVNSNIVKTLITTSINLLKNINNYKDLVSSLSGHHLYNTTTDNIDSPFKLMEKLYKRIEQIIANLRAIFQNKEYFNLQSTSTDDLTNYCSELFKIFEIGIETNRPLLMNLYKTLETYLNNHLQIIEHIEYRSLFEKISNSAQHNLNEYIMLISKDQDTQDKKKFLKLAAFTLKCQITFYKIFSSNFLSLPTYIQFLVRSYSYFPPLSRLKPDDLENVKELLQNYDEAFQLLISDHGESVVDHMLPWVSKVYQDQYITVASKNHIISMTSEPSSSTSGSLLFGKLKLLVMMFNGGSNYNGNLSTQTNMNLLRASFDIMTFCIQDIMNSRYIEDITLAQFSYIVFHPELVSMQLFIHLSNYLIQPNHPIIKQSVATLWKNIIISFQSNSTMVDWTLQYLIHQTQSFQTKYTENINETMHSYHVIFAAYLSQSSYQDQLYSKLVSEYLDKDNYFIRPILPTLYFESFEECDSTLPISPTVKKNVEERLIPNSLKLITQYLEPQSFDQMENILLLLNSINFKLPLHLKTQIITEYINLLQSLTQQSNKPNTLESLIIFKLNSLSNSILPKQLPNLISFIADITDIISHSVQINTLLISLLNADLYEQLDQYSLQTTVSSLGRIFSRMTLIIKNNKIYNQLKNTIESYSKHFTIKSMPSPVPPQLKIIDKPKILPIPTIPLPDHDINNINQECLFKYTNHTEKDLCKFTIIPNNININNTSNSLNGNGNGNYNSTNNIKNNNNNMNGNGNGNGNGNSYGYGVVRSQMDLMSGSSSSSSKFINQERTCSDSLDIIKKNLHLFFDTIDSNSIDRASKNRLRKELDEICKSAQLRNNQE